MSFHMGQFETFALNTSPEGMQAAEQLFTATPAEAAVAAVAMKKAQKEKLVKTVAIAAGAGLLAVMLLKKK